MQTSTRVAFETLVRRPSTRQRHRIALSLWTGGKLPRPTQRCVGVSASSASDQLGTAPSAEDMTLGELLVVGPGVLGSFLAKLWIENGGKVTGRTNTVSNHARFPFGNLSNFYNSHVQVSIDRHLP